MAVNQGDIIILLKKKGKSLYTFEIMNELGIKNKVNLTRKLDQLFNIGLISKRRSTECKWRITKKGKEKRRKER